MYLTRETRAKDNNRRPPENSKTICAEQPEAFPSIFFTTNLKSRSFSWKIIKSQCVTMLSLVKYENPRVRSQLDSVPLGEYVNPFYILSIYFLKKKETISSKSAFLSCSTPFIQQKSEYFSTKTFSSIFIPTVVGWPSTDVWHNPRNVFIFKKTKMLCVCL